MSCRRGVRALALALTVVAAAGCRQDMHDAARYDPLEASAFFPDGHAARPFVANTVARGQLREDDHLYRGRVNGQLADTFPMPVTVLELGLLAGAFGAGYRMEKRPLDLCVVNADRLQKQNSAMWEERLHVLIQK